MTTTIAQIEDRFPAGQTVRVHGRALTVDGVIASGPATRRHGPIALVGLTGPRKAIYTVWAYADGSIGDLVRLPRM